MWRTLMAERVANITETGIRRRRRIGYVMSFVSIAMAAVFIATDVPRSTRLILFFPIAIAVNGFLQAREKTCVVLGVMGTQETEEGGYARMPAAECESARRQVVSIVVKDIVIAAAATAAIWFV